MFQIFVYFVPEKLTVINCNKIIKKTAFKCYKAQQHNNVTILWKQCPHVCVCGVYNYVCGMSVCTTEEQNNR